MPVLPAQPRSFLYGASTLNKVIADGSVLSIQPSLMDVERNLIQPFPIIVTRRDMGTRIRKTREHLLYRGIHRSPSIDRLLFRAAAYRDQYSAVASRYTLGTSIVCGSIFWGESQGSGLPLPAPALGGGLFDAF
jgi:hypothetical protein